MRVFPDWLGPEQAGTGHGAGGAGQAELILALCDNVARLLKRYQCSFW